MAIMQNIVFFSDVFFGIAGQIFCQKYYKEILPQSRGQKSKQNIDQVKGSQLKTPLIR